VQGTDALDPGGNFIQLEAFLHRLQAACDNLIQVNQRAMVAKSEAAAGVARRWFLTTLIIASSLVVAGTGLAVFLADRIVRPLRELTATMEKIATGHPAVAPVGPGEAARGATDDPGGHRFLV
jgi:nitrogen fixation/metabolism regulation signal transduction histidine kinase